MKMLRNLATVAGVACMTAGAASAQTVGMGTTKGGATAQLSNALAAVISDGSELMVRPQAMANTSQYLPLVDSGRLEFGIANLPQLSFAISGTGLSEGQPNPNLVMVATLVPFTVGLLVPESLGIDTTAGLKGKRVPRFPAGSLGDRIIAAGLETAGLTYDDVTSVPVANFPAMFEGVKDGATDVTIAAVGSKPTFDIEAATGGVVFLNFAPESEKVWDANMPGTKLTKWTGKPVPGISEDTVIMYYPYTLFAGKDVDPAIVAAAAKALYEGEKALKANGPLWADYEPAKLAEAQSLEYHPGAVEYYKSVGIWPGE